VCVGNMGSFSFGLHIDSRRYYPVHDSLSVNGMFRTVS